MAQGEVLYFQESRQGRAPYSLAGESHQASGSTPFSVPDPAPAANSNNSGSVTSVKSLAPLARAARADATLALAVGRLAYTQHDLTTVHLGICQSTYDSRFNRDRLSRAVTLRTASATNSTSQPFVYDEESRSWHVYDADGHTGPNPSLPDPSFHQHASSLAISGAH